MTLAFDTFDTFGVYGTTHVVVIRRTWWHAYRRLVSGLGWRLRLAFTRNVARIVLRAIRRCVSFGVANATRLVEKRGANHFAVRTGLVLHEVAGVLGLGTPGILANLAKRSAAAADAVAVVRLGIGIGIGISVVRHLIDKRCN